MRRECQRSQLGFLSVGLALLAGTGLKEARADGWRLSIHGSTSQDVVSPAVVRVSEALPVGIYDVETPGRADTIAAQVFSDEGQRWLSIILPSGRSDSTAILKPTEKQVIDSDKGVQFTPRGPNLAITIDRRPFSEYRIDEGAKPFLHPLIGPTQASYTRAFPMEKVSGSSSPEIVLVLPREGQRRRFLVGAREARKYQGNRTQDGTLGAGRRPAADHGRLAFARGRESLRGRESPYSLSV
jgi:hypothetical protein